MGRQLPQKPFSLQVALASILCLQKHAEALFADQTIGSQPVQPPPREVRMGSHTFQQKNVGGCKCEAAAVVLG